MSTELASLYDIQGAIVGLMELRAEAEAEGDAAQLAVLDKEIDAWIAQEIRKVDHIAAYIKECERRATIEVEEGERHLDRAAVWQARADRVRTSALAAMQAHDIKVVETPQNTIRRQKNGGLDPVEFADDAIVPIHLCRAILRLPGMVFDTIRRACIGLPQLDQYFDAAKVEPDTALIRAALKRGEEIPGARLAERGEHLRLE